MRYKNINTGAMIDSSSKITSKNWVEVGKPVPEKGEFDRLTKNELFELLEEKGISYKPEQTKKELIALLEGD